MGPHVRLTKLLVRLAALEKGRLIFKNAIKYGLNISSLFVLASFLNFMKDITPVWSLHIALHTNTDSVTFGLCIPIKIILIITLIIFFICNETNWEQQRNVPFCFCFEYLLSRSLSIFLNLVSWKLLDLPCI